MGLTFSLYLVEDTRFQNIFISTSEPMIYTERKGLTHKLRMLTMMSIMMMSLALVQEQGLGLAVEQDQEQDCQTLR